MECHRVVVEPELTQCQLSECFTKLLVIIFSEVAWFRTNSC